MFFARLAVALLLPVIPLCTAPIMAEQQPLGATTPMVPPTQVYTAAALPLTVAPASTAESSSLDNAPPADGGAVRSVLPPHSLKGPEESRPFRSLGVSFSANTFGASVQVATPLSRSVKLRTGLNFFVFSYPFNLDGLEYQPRFLSESIQTTVDWSPMHGVFHISPGFLYFKNSVDAAINVGPGQSVTLYGYPLFSGVDDPVNGSASVVYARRIAPMLTIGSDNPIARSHGHLSVPLEIGAAYTGAAHMTMQLNGSACTTQGCFNFNSNSNAVASLNQEVGRLNSYLAKVTVYPILSVGLTYHFSFSGARAAD
jgi:hypothetical protein